MQEIKEKRMIQYQAVLNVFKMAYNSHSDSYSFFMNNDNLKIAKKIAKDNQIDLTVSVNFRNIISKIADSGFIFVLFFYMFAWDFKDQYKSPFFLGAMVCLSVVSLIAGFSLSINKNMINRVSINTKKWKSQENPTLFFN